ncbi:MAG: glycosyltransferase family 4 protein [Planctomycetota bacterium]
MRSSILFLGPSFMETRGGAPIRGVQLFDMHLVRELVGLGHSVTVVAERSWRRRLEEAFGAVVGAGGSGGARAGSLEVAWTPNLRKPIWNGLWALAGLGIRRRRFDRLVVGNISRGIGPIAERVIKMGLAPAGVVIAHKGGHPGIYAPFRRARLEVLAINPLIASQCVEWPVRVMIRYGVANADAFFPPDDWPGRLGREATPERPVRIVVLGKLDTPWKGAAEAIEAVRRLPGQDRARVELHLASYAVPPEIEAGVPVVVYPWLDASEIPGLVRTMDAMLVPSLSERETFSQAIVQGMLTGLPIVASDVPVLAEKLDAGGGVTFERAGDVPGQLTALIADRVIGDPGWRVSAGQAARRTAVERYVWDSAWFSEEFLGGEMASGRRHRIPGTGHRAPGGGAGRSGA